VADVTEINVFMLMTKKLTVDEFCPKNPVTAKTAMEQVYIVAQCVMFYCLE
jgi:hypothetical protein